MMLWEDAISLVQPLADPKLLDLIQRMHKTIRGRHQAADGDVGAVQRAQALAALPRCAHLACTNLAGASEALLHTRACSGCRVARYCSTACQLADWRAGHKSVCALLAALRAREQTKAVQGARSEGGEAN